MLARLDRAASFELYGAEAKMVRHAPGHQGIRFCPARLELIRWEPNIERGVFGIFGTQKIVYREQ
jgi:hypothetical protein